MTPVSARIAIVVLGCVSPPYDRTIEAIRRTWGCQRQPGIDIYYLYGNPDDDDGRRVLARYLDGPVPVVDDDSLREAGDVLIAGCADHVRQQPDCLLRKRLQAYAHLSAGDRYDLLYTVCATSYVDQVRLAEYAATLASRPLVAGAIGLSGPSQAPFVSGASMMLSMDVAAELGRQRAAIIAGNIFGHHDDVTVGHWIATHLSPVPLATFVEDIQQRRPMTAQHIFVSCPRRTVDYVMTPSDQHRRVGNAFHYHFHSQKADDMVRFHNRGYAS